MKRLLKVGCIMAISAALVLSGCGNRASDSGSQSNQGAQGAPQQTPAASGSSPSPKQDEPVTLNVATAGDTNMEELQTQKVGPLFTKQYPNVKLNVVGTGPGDAGSEKIYSKLKAQKDAGKDEWDIDVAIVHQSIMAQMMEEGLLEQYVPASANRQYVTSSDSRNSLGVNVDGYVIPLFHSQVAIAYNPDKVQQMPQNFEELVAWIKANPKRFGYNGIKNGMSGVAFVTAYTYWRSGDYKQLVAGPFDEKLEEKWPDIIKELKSLPVTYTNGNNGTLDMLNRGEIDMGPVWVDMFLTWKAEGRMNPNNRMKIIDPGLPGQPMYVVVPKNAKNKEWAIKFADFLTSPEIQASVIVEQMGWYPGINVAPVLPLVSEEARKNLFTDISAEDLAQRVLEFPLVQYLKDLQTAYERY